MFFSKGALISSNGVPTLQAAYIGEEIEDTWGRYPGNGLDEVPCTITADFLDYLQVYSVQLNVSEIRAE